MKFKILKECVIDHKYYEPGDNYEFTMNGVEEPTYIFMLKKHGFMEEVPEQPKTVWDLKDGDEYWVILPDGMTESKVCGHMRFEKEYREIGNCFLTKEDAEKELAHRKARAVLERDAKGVKQGVDRYSYYVYYNYGSRKLRIDYYTGTNLYGLLAFATEADAKDSIKAHEKEWKAYLRVEE